MKRVIILALAVLAFAGCAKKDEEMPTPSSPAPAPKPGANLEFTVDGQSLAYDMISYFNAAGNNYGVTRLQFYLSGFEFEATDGTTYNSDKIWYVDAREGTNGSIPFDYLPFGTYKKVTFYIGLDSAHNYTGSLPATLENENMAWPVQMGGGYHFLKFEGNFEDQGNTFGFAMHLGRNQFLITVEINSNFEFTAAAPDIVLSMNLNEWFVNPFIYDFNVDGNYSMGVGAAMGKLAANGADVFTIKP